MDWPDDEIEAGFEATWESYLSALDRELAERDGQVRPMPGVNALLEAIEADDRLAQGLVTGNMEGGARRKLEAAGLAGRFGFGAYGSDSECREDLPPLARDRAQRRYARLFNMETSVVVGDTPEDIRCARANGARALAVSTGRHSLEELREHGPDAVFENLSDTSRVVRILADE
jgi:phosphoglycolate phosphatase-like HAD superfamily hydrolase